MKLKGKIYWSVFGLLLLLLSINVIVTIITTIDAIFDVISKETSGVDVFIMYAIDVLIIILITVWSTIVGSWRD